MPVLTGAGRKPSVTFSPLCNPTPVTLTEFFNVRCLTIAVFITEIMFLFYHSLVRQLKTRLEKPIKISDTAQV